MTGTASWLELIWTLSGIVGFSVCAWALNAALAAMRWAEVAGLDIDADDPEALDEQEAREIIARGDAIDETLRCIAQLLTVASGLVALTLPGSATVTEATGRALIVGCIVGIQALLVAKSIIALHRRQQIIAVLGRRACRRQTE